MKFIVECCNMGPLEGWLTISDDEFLKEEDDEEEESNVPNKKDSDNAERKISSSISLLISSS